MLERNIFAAILPVVLMVSCGSSRHTGKKPTEMAGTWQVQPIVIDGDSKDWPSPYPNYDAKAMVAYATSNDKENLYITMETGDELTQIKILKQGMIVSIDTNGKKDPQFHINFPLLNDNDPLEIPKSVSNPNSQQGMHLGSMIDKQIIRSAQDANQYALDGFGACNGGFMITQTSPCGVKVRVKIDEYQELVWEAVVPFKALYNKETISAADRGKPISVCFAVKGFKKAANKAENSNGGMNQQGAPGGMNGGKSGMGRGGGSTKGGGRSVTENPMDKLYESTKTWKQFGVAYQP